ncbi:MAG: superoxide dismutase family protein [Myxococcales bacterium]|nr:superoxide dismutase family protein [Myxococcales bacterium]
MRKHIALASLFFALSFSACKDDEAKETTKTSETPTAPKAKDTAPAKPAIPTAPKASEAIMAQAKVIAASGSKVSGTVHFSMKGETVGVHATISGLAPGEHGFHVHEKGDCSSPDAKSAGGHFNPHSVDHGDPKGETHHAGDLGNIAANAEGTAELTVDLPSSFLSLAPDAANNIVGRAVVVHGGVDDLKSQPSGASGPRVGCGVIEMYKAE